MVPNNKSNNRFSRRSNSRNQETRVKSPQKARWRNEHCIWHNWFHHTTETNAKDSWSRQIISLQALFEVLKTMCTSNKHAIELLEQKHNEISIELRAILKTNEKNYRSHRNNKKTKFFQTPEYVPYDDLNECEQELVRLSIRSYQHQSRQIVAALLKRK